MIATIKCGKCEAEYPMTAIGHGPEHPLMIVSSDIRMEIAFNCSSCGLVAELPRAIQPTKVLPHQRQSHLY